jgi:L-rhamnose mutarotase
MRKQLLIAGIVLGGTVACTAMKDKPALASVVEIIGNDSISTERLSQICLSGNIPASVYRWKNHTALYGIFDDLPEIREQIAKMYPGATIKLYDKPFYIFERSSCGDNTQAKQWTHTLMTANLAADTVMQQEYMKYHATQPEQFPEVVQGFCHAGFQQLLVFRNGRQLMLVISIPKGENLDDLNPKTTENNPRADEWNSIMANYQEGIDDAEPGEVWVTFNSIK